MAKISHFWPKCPKKGFLAGIPRKRGFRALFGPGRQGFYINPSRRGPAVPGGRSHPREAEEAVGRGRRAPKGSWQPALAAAARPLQVRELLGLIGAARNKKTTRCMFPTSYRISHYLTLEGRGGLEGLHAPWRPGPGPGGTPAGTAGPRREGLM